MDKLLKLKFWILSALAIPLALAGYFTANGAVLELTKSKVEAYETALNGVASGNVENEKFTQRVSELAEEIRLENEKELLGLWDIQKKWYTWPALIEKGLPKNPVNGEIMYPGDAEADAKFEFTLKSVPIDYPQQYTIQMNRLYDSLDPVLYFGDEGFETSKTKNRVFIDQSAIPRHEFLTGVLYPSEAILEAQEDYWLLKMLVTAINNVNQAEDVNKSPIVEIKLISLFGGSGTTTVTAEAATDPSGTSPIEGGMPMVGGANDPNGQGGISFLSSSIEFDPAEEYGSLVDETAAAADGGGEVIAVGGTGAATAKARRYVGDPKTGPYRQRAFYMSILIDETKIADLFAALSSLDPPIRTGRFTITNNPYDDDDLMRISGATKGGRPMAGGINNERGNLTGNRGGGGGGWSVSGPKVGNVGEGLGRANDGNVGGRPVRGVDPLGDGQNPVTTDPYSNARKRSDLVRLDFIGLITMFKQPAAVRNAVAEEVQPAPPTTEGNAETGNTETTEATETGNPASPADAGTTPATEGAPAETSTPESTDPTPTATTPAPEPPATTTPPLEGINIEETSTPPAAGTDAGT
ncbi:MAG: hypothetical protein R3C01_00280 [Planctomycetaceae bacterium]